MTSHTDSHVPTGRPSVHPADDVDASLRLGVVVGSTRPGRRAPAVAQWVVQVAAAHLLDAGVELRTFDLADFALPLLDEPVPAAFGEYAHAHTRLWAQAIDGCDGFLFVTPEYNHSLPAALKNALDFLYAEWHHKAAGMVGYGVDGGLRAIEHLRQVLAELRIADVRSAVTLSLAEDFADGAFSPRTHQTEQMRRVLDDLVDWSHALRGVRTR